MAINYIHEYHAEIAKLRAISGSSSERILRPAFENCLRKYCRQLDLTLLPELSYRHGTRRIYPDATISDSFRTRWGYWEAKDEDDDLPGEITKKLALGYPTTNIIFEDTRAAVLIQGGEQVLQVDMANAGDLHRLITRFFEYLPKPIAGLREAFRQFQQDLPYILESLRGTIDKSRDSNSQFHHAVNNFLALCRKTINPDIASPDVREMLIQHILTKDIFLKVFGDDQFHKENNIAARLTELEDTFFIGNVKRAAVDRHRAYYATIAQYAAAVESYSEKQRFLKAVYEDFYKAYNRDAADRLGIVYTPNEIVEFMIKFTDHLVSKHFGRHLYDKEVHILDPSVGTGTFITDLIELAIPNAHLPYKYKHEIHANEVGILPYYIANLNIEYTYKQKMDHYEEFPNICFVDTLDNVHYNTSKEQQDLVHTISAENLKRVTRQNKKTISVIIGNPPYNDSQQNWNDGNPNRKYPEVDKRIKETYIKHSASRKTHQYDMYKRFIRWASDRLGDNGVIAFITNRSYIDSRQDDGFRKVVAKEFSAIDMVDLGGDARTMPGCENVFGDQTRVGVAIGFFVKQQGHDGCRIRYARRPDYESTADKLAFLVKQVDDEFSGINFEHITPDGKSNWLEQANNDFDRMVCLADERTKRACTQQEERHYPAIFKMYAPGVKTNRDEWIYDHNDKNLRHKVKFFATTYNQYLKKGDISYGSVIKGSRDLNNQFRRKNRIVYDANLIVRTMYRPFTKRFFFASMIMNDVLTANHHKMFGEKLNKKNKVICISAPSTPSPFYALAVMELTDFHFAGDTQCLPLYFYDEDGNRHNNLTEWSLQQFRDHYEDKGITAEDIFHYIYAVLHHPTYHEKYAVNLKQGFPRVPFYGDFPQWVKWGEQLADIHINFAKQPAHPLTRKDSTASPPGNPKLKAIPQSGRIVVDEQTALEKIPPLAWEYRLGRRSALEWVLDQYKEKKPRDRTVPEKFHTYRFADHKEQVIDLLGGVCTVSVKTMEIIGQMPEFDNKE